MTERAKESNLLKGIGAMTDSSITLIQYAYDILFFCEARKRFMNNLNSCGIFLSRLLESRLTKRSPNYFIWGVRVEKIVDSLISCNAKLESCLISI